MVDHCLGNQMDYFNSSIFNVKYDLAQNLIYKFPVSLKHMALVKISLMFWQQDDIRNEIRITISNGISIGKFYAHEAAPIPQIFQKISSLSLPKSFEEILKRMIKSTGIQIFKYLSLHKEYDSSLLKNMKLYWDNICWTQQGTINSLNSAKLLVEHAQLGSREKYIIGCNNCLEHKLNDLLRQLPDEVIKSFPETYNYRLVTFWTCRLSNENEKFSSILRREFNFEVNNNKYIFEWAIRNKNEVAVEYIWKHFASEEMKENQLRITRDATGRALFSDYIGYNNISCFLLTQLNQSQIEDICTRRGYIILLLLSEYRGSWNPYFFSTTKYMLQYFSKMEVFDALEIVVLCWNNNRMNKENMINILNDFIIIFSNDVKQHFVKICIIFLNSLFKMEDEEAIKYFLSNGLAQDKKTVMYTTAGINFCEKLIILGKLDLLCLLIREMLVTEEINNYKNDFFKGSGFKICFELVMKDRYQILDAFLDLYCTQEEIRKLKNNLPYEEDAKIINFILKWTAKKDTLQLIRIDEFLNWCFVSNEEHIYCKNEIFDPDKCKFKDCNDRILKRVSVLIKDGEWQLVDEYIKWTFSTMDKVLKFKKKLAGRTDISIKLMHDLILRGDDLKSFLRYINFLPQDEVDKLKIEMKCTGKLLSVVRELIHRNKSIEVENLLKWWFHSPKAIAMFKAEL